MRSCFWEARLVRGLFFFAYQSLELSDEKLLLESLLELPQSLELLLELLELPQSLLPELLELNDERSDS